MTIQVFCVFVTSWRLPTHVVFVPTSDVWSSVVPRLFQSVTIKRQAVGHEEEARGVTCTWPLILIFYFVYFFILFSTPFSGLSVWTTQVFNTLRGCRLDPAFPLVLFWRAFIFRPIINNTMPDVCSSRLKTAPLVIRRFIKKGYASSLQTGSFLLRGWIKIRLRLWRVRMLRMGMRNPFSLKGKGIHLQQCAYLAFFNFIYLFLIKVTRTSFKESLNKTFHFSQMKYAGCSRFPPSPPAATLQTIRNIAARSVVSLLNLLDCSSQKWEKPRLVCGSGWFLLRRKV